MKGKATIILITHKLNVLQAVDKIAVLNAGQLVYFGERDAVLAKLSGNTAPATKQVKTAAASISLDDAKEDE